MRIWHLIRSGFVFSLLVILSGCSDDNGSDISDTKYHTKYEYSVTFAGDWADVCKATAYTVAFNEHKPTQAVDFSNEAKWTYENGALPDSTGVLIEFSPDNVDGWNKEIYALCISRRIQITVTDESGTVVDSQTSQSSKSVNIRKDMLTEYLAKPLRMTGKADANGSISFSTEIDFGLNTETVDMADFEVESAVPVFIGYTEYAKEGYNKAIKISSIKDYIEYFGGAPSLDFAISISSYFEDLSEEEIRNMPDDGNGKVRPSDAIAELKFKDKEYDPINEYCKSASIFVTGKVPYTLYYNMLLFFANGGGSCYVVSVGKYSKDKQIEADKLKNGIKALETISDATVLVIPEAINLNDIDLLADIQRTMLNHCGKNGMFALLDVCPMTEKENSYIDSYHEKIGLVNLSYGAAYYPNLNTSIFEACNLNGNMFTWDESLFRRAGEISFWDLNFANIVNTYSQSGIPQDKSELYSALNSSSPVFKELMKETLDRLNILSPSAAMAGIYTMVDNSRGVWKAPANVPLNDVVGSTIYIDDDEQAKLNAPIDGKAINTIRFFRGEGIKIWGARTLDGNSLDWRFINVRRNFMTIEKSLDKCINTCFLSKPNNEGTWSELRNVLYSYCNSLWKRGALAGAQKEEAYEVHVGVGDSMSQEDISKGIMRVTLQLALSHPYEFIEITKEYKMQQ